MKCRFQTEFVVKILVSFLICITKTTTTTTKVGKMNFKVGFIMMKQLPTHFE
jgi:hypothetical protein